MEIDLPVMLFGFALTAAQVFPVKFIADRFDRACVLCLFGFFQFSILLKRLRAGVSTVKG